MKKIGIAAAMFLPMVAFAQTTDINGLVAKIIAFINGTIVPAIFALAFVVFIWGVFQYFILKGEEGHEAGRKKIGYGIAAFVIMASVWGLVNFVLNTLDYAGIDSNDTIDAGDLPKAPTVR